MASDNDKKQVPQTTAQKIILAIFSVGCLVMVFFCIRGAMGHSMPNIAFPIMGVLLVLLIINLIITKRTEKRLSEEEKR